MAGGDRDHGEPRFLSKMEGNYVPVGKDPPVVLVITMGDARSNKEMLGFRKSFEHTNNAKTSSRALLHH